MSKKILISPSILSANFAELGNEVKNLEEAGADMIHVDVMDGFFVPNITIGPCVISSIRKHTKLPLDVHLMISPVDHLLQSFINCGSDMITIHHESVIHVHQILKTIKYSGKKAGIAINPSTSPDAIKYLLDTIDLVLVMTVNPGFAGQKMITSQIEKISIIREMINNSDHKEIQISVDGGIDAENAQSLIDAGADILISGTAIFKNGTYKENINRIRGVIENE